MTAGESARRRGAGKLSALAMACFIVLFSTGALRADDGDGDDSPVRIVNDNTVDLDKDAMANVDVTTVAEDDYPDVLSIMGTISPIENRVTSVPARTAGRIDSVLKVTGEYVKAGDALALEYSPDFIQTRQEYLDARKSGFSELMASSRKKLVNLGLIESDIERLGKPGDDPDHLVIRASRAGAITMVNTAVGNMQNQGDTLMTVSDLDQVWFTGDLYSEDLTKVRPGQTIGIESEGLSKTLMGKISFISPVIDPNAHTIKVRAMIENPDRVLRGSMVVEGDVVLSSRPELAVPTTALMNLHNQIYCFKKVGDSAGYQRFEEVPVTVGQEEAGLAVVLSGLKEGDQIISAGGLLLDYAFQGD
ncbi:MAG TPA: efflux RND transporter periplasmic adaptor subunit [bacterium]|jgi:Cu(I)/Ag(I) efflux system membrane fusion protein|nr:efflux RND transporter periplasmic adaptor subunit [bacterium]